MKKLTLAAVMAAGVLGAGCTTIQTRATGKATVNNSTFEETYTAVTQAALSAGFTITSTDKDSGFITATRGANPMLAHHNPVINIAVASNGSATTVTIASTIGGQIADYGITQETIADFCRSLEARMPQATCTAF